MSTNPLLLNTASQLLRGRLGIPVDADVTTSSDSPLSQLSNRLGLSGNSDVEQLKPQLSAIDGVNDAANYLKKIGGYRQQDRMITDKRKNLDRAVKYSYQGAFVTKIVETTETTDTMTVVGDTTSPTSVRALINPNRLKQDYDDKIISIGYEHQFKPGDVFKWDNTGTYWLIYLQDLTELAYFRGDIRKCRYQISFKDEVGNTKNVYAAVRGPVETKLDSTQKENIIMDTPNSSLNILMPKNADTLKAFQRYNKFFLKTVEDGHALVWRVEATDSVSMPGILEINAIEYYVNTSEDDTTNSLVGGLIVEAIDPNTEESNEAIVGETFIKPKKEYTYTFSGALISDWTIEAKTNAISYEEIDEHTIKLKWNSSYSGQFNLKYGTFTKTIVVESLF